MLCGKQVNEVERRLLALPYSYGGLGLANPALSAQYAFDASKFITEPLCQLIYDQQRNLEHLNRDEIKKRKREVAQRKNERLLAEKESIEQDLDRNEFSHNAMLDLVRICQ